MQQEDQLKKQIYVLEQRSLKMPQNYPLKMKLKKLKVKLGEMIAKRRFEEFLAK